MDLEHFPESAAALRMLSYVTKGWYDRSYIGKWIYEVMGREMDTAVKIYEELPDQFFVSTATWGLRYHEVKYGLPVREDLSYEERRALILQKRESKYSMTPYRMETILFERFGAEVHVYDTNDPGGLEYSHPNIFAVLFSQDGTEAGFDISEARALIQKLKLSHTMYDLLYCHYVWVEHQTDYDVGLIFTTGVEARSPLYFNYTPRYLDGTYMLDGTYRLNGYLEEGASGEFYDAGMAYRAEVDSGIEIAYGYGYAAQAAQDVSVELDSASAVIPVIETAEMVPALTARSEVYSSTEYAADIEVKQNLWYLDGTYRLDGSRMLNAKHYWIDL